VPHLSRHDRKCGDYRWNRSTIAFRSKVITTFDLYRGHFEFPTSVDVGPCRPMSDNGCSATGRSGCVETVVIAFEIASPSLSFKSYFHSSGFVAYILSSGCWPMSDIVSSAIHVSKSGLVKMWGSRWNCVAWLSVQHLFPLPVCIAAILSFQRRAVSSNVAVTQTG